MPHQRRGAARLQDDPKLKFFFFGRFLEGSKRPRNATCQKYLRETDAWQYRGCAACFTENGAASIVSAISAAVTGKATDDDEDDLDK